MNDCSGYIQFLAEARSGDRAAMGRLATLVWERLYPFAFRTTLDHNAAEDVLQETLLAMICRLGALRDKDRFWPWIYRIAWSKVQDRVRDRQLRSSFETQALRCGAAASSGYRPNIDPADAQVRDETRQQVAAAVERLSHDHRDILRLRCYDQLPYTEIAVLTRTTPAKARVHFHRAKQSLKERLACCM
jgi:RNA polymerase sigma-70 factor (ECF subfamily)